MPDTLNDLTGSQWIFHSISWFQLQYAKRNRKKAQHPASYPEELAMRFIELFTKKGEWVLDPFLGTGTTLLACRTLLRNGVGIELVDRFYTYARDQLAFKTIIPTGTQIPLHGNSLDLHAVLHKKFGTAIPQFRFVMCSPPYWNMLHKSRGGSDSSQKARLEAGKTPSYSDLADDLGNCADYGEFLGKLIRIFRAIHPLLIEGAYLVLILQNFRNDDGTFVPFAWDVAYKLHATGLYSMCQEQIWCQTDKRSGIWGFPKTYITNTHHQYCIVLQKVSCANSE